MMRTPNVATKLRWTSPSFVTRVGKVIHRKDRSPRSKRIGSSVGASRASPDSIDPAASGGSVAARGKARNTKQANRDECGHSAGSLLESDEVDSLLSNPEGDTVWDEIQFDETEDPSELEYLEAKFARRDRILDQISQGKSRTFVELMRLHEQEVRSDERERLMLKLMYATQRPKDVTGEEARDVDKPSLNSCRAANDTAASFSVADRTNATVHVVVDGEPTRNASTATRARDFVVYELSTTLPATLSFVAQTVTEYASYEITSMLVWLARRHIRANSDKFQDGLMMLIFAVGLFLMRCSGSLYWWLSDRDYGCVKFEMHNRLRLGMWDARVLRWARRRPRVRCFLFLFGYYLCFAGTLHFVHRFYLLWDESDRLMRRLPSSSYDDSVCMADLDRFSCEAELQRRERHFDALEEEDREHVYRFWSDRSYDFYWVEGAEGIGAYGYPLLSWNRELALLIATLGVSLTALTWYGFIFWNKY